MTEFILGVKSLKELEGVHPKLVAVVQRAIVLTQQDFTVFDGLRTLEEQKEMVRTGASTTMNSKHLRQADGYGHAVDLVPWINGKPRWEWLPIYTIAESVRLAAKELGVALRWGGAWCRFDNTTEMPVELVENYVLERKKLGFRAFIDGPHYELLED